MEDIELDLQQVLLIFKKSLVFIIVITLACGAAAYAITTVFIQPMYTASASLYVYSDTESTGDSITSAELTASQELVNTYLVVLKSDAVLDEVIKTLDLGFTASDIRDMLTASSIDGTEAFSVEITYNDPVMAQLMVNTIIEIAPEQIIRVVKAGGVEVIDSAKLPATPSSPNIKLNTLIGALIGFFLTFGIIILIVKFDTKVRDEDDLIRTFTIPVLGNVPTLVDQNTAGYKKEV